MRSAQMTQGEIMRAFTCWAAAALFLASGVGSPAWTQQLPAARQPVPPPAAVEPAAESIPTRLMSFGVPFTVSAQDPLPQEVQLYVSGDRGVTWSLYGRKRPAANMAPEESEFPFRAARDGLYWFALRTIDRSGHARPDGPLQPELKVLVDTTPPQLELNANVGAAGELATSWKIYDQHLAYESFKLEYQPAGPATSAPAWQSVAVELPRDGALRTLLTGNTSWWAKTDAAAIDVRAEVRDTAGNVTVVNRRVNLPRVAKQPDQNKTAQPPAYDPFTRPAQSRGELAAPPSVPPNSDLASTPWPADNEASGLAQGNSRPAPASTTRGGQFRSDVVGFRPPSSPVNPSTADQAIEPSAVPASGVRTAKENILPRMTNSRRFNLRYDVDTVGPSGVASVELWATRDGGRTWNSWGADPDRTSPYVVDVDEDGVYGFRVVIANGEGLAGHPPQPGDAADIWVGVDTTLPTARIVSAPFGIGPYAGHLTINWEAADDHLRERPVALLFSETADGAWQTIAAGLSNTGQYQWRVDARVPRQVYLRLEVRDEAGNVGFDQLARPISVEALVPKGRILDFQPISVPDREAFRPRSIR